MVDEYTRIQSSTLEICLKLKEMFYIKFPIRNLRHKLIKSSEARN